MTDVFEPTPCDLGEGPFWHPLRQQFFWFDILGRKLCAFANGERHEWQFDEYVSAAGVVDTDRLLVASQTQLMVFNLESGEQEYLVGLEVDNPLTRSNDGRADTFGGFWIGTMGIEAEPKAGAIYRYYRGELRKLFTNISISNAICFSPDGKFAYFADTPTRKIMRQALDPVDGWPVGKPDLWLDLNEQGMNPDGAVVDAAGNLWNAQWGAARVACYSPEGVFLREVKIPASQCTCPAFGGKDLSDLLITSASTGLTADQISAEGGAGRTFLAPGAGKGQPENLVVL